MTYVYQCPTGHGRFEERRPASESGEPGTCPSCQSPAPRVFCFQADQLHLPRRFGVTIPTTGWKTTHGGGEWESAVRDYQRWDSGFTGPIPGTERPAHAEG